VTVISTAVRCNLFHHNLIQNYRRGAAHDEYDASNNVDLYPTVQLQRDRARHGNDIYIYI